MTKYSHLTKKSATKKISKRGISFKLNIKFLNGFIGVLILAFGLGYLVQINGLATKGYKITELENTISNLELKRADLELEALSLQSMGSVKNKVGGLGMVAVGEAQYLNVTPVAVAR